MKEAAVKHALCIFHTNDGPVTTVCHPCTASPDFWIHVQLDVTSSILHHMSARQALLLSNI